ncbi:MAG TPA: DUF885 family protein, partial [Vicinamibacterales bacterium]|nr:DUF885 family protein [Vicinamibacterales bacterium]
MHLHWLTTSTLCAMLALAPAASATFDQAAAQAPAAPQTVPSDLRPLLTPKTSEMAIVARTYTLDRQTLNTNYAGSGSGGGRGRGGRGGGAAAAAPQAPPSRPVSMSLARIDRLRRFDTAWQTALAALDAGSLSAAAKTELDALGKTVAANLAALDAERQTIATLTPLLPFAAPLVDTIEARIWIKDMDAQAAAGVLTRATESITATRARIQAGLDGGANALTASTAQAEQAAVAVEGLTRELEEWFNFYNGYDPLFTWWMGLPWQHAQAALTQYAAFLRSTVAPANRAAAPPAALPATAATANPREDRKFGDVPDLKSLIALPQDELTDIVALYRAGTGGGGRGGRGAAPARGADYYRQWLRALTSLDFDELSRNAQVNYLFIKKMSEIRIARDGRSLPAPEANPRKADQSGIPGPARGREGLIWDLQDVLIPYTPEELIALAEAEFAWCDQEMLKASREMGFGDNWKAAMEKVKSMHAPPGGQPAVIRDLMHEAVDYVRGNNLITVPPVAAESLHMAMMSPERQLVNPFFTGGARITVSYPTNTMAHDARLQSMRGNTTAFSHATAHHEMIPGHNFTGYIGSRFDDYRADLGAGTPFFGEGWALYWELVLYDKGFNDTPEERIGALFWRMHRCARIIFSLNFHMGRWSP